MLNSHGHHNCDIKFFTSYLYLIRYTDLEERNRTRELYGLSNIAEDKALACNVRPRHDTDISLHFAISTLLKFVHVLATKETSSR